MKSYLLTIKRELLQFVEKVTLCLALLRPQESEETVQRVSSKTTFTFSHIILPLQGWLQGPARHRGQGDTPLHWTSLSTGGQEGQGDLGWYLLFTWWDQVRQSPCTLWLCPSTWTAGRIRNTWIIAKRQPVKWKVSSLFLKSQNIFNIEMKISQHGKIVGKNFNWERRSYRNNFSNYIFRNLFFWRQKKPSKKGNIKIVIVGPNKEMPLKNALIEFIEFKMRSLFLEVLRKRDNQLLKFPFFSVVR